MTALTQDRHTPMREGDLALRPMAASTEIFAGSLVMLNASGYLVPGATATGQTCAGRAEEHKTNGSTAGATSCEVRRGVFCFANSASGDLITIAEVGTTCYIVDDQTVAKTNGTNTRSAAGTVVDVDAGGVWVRVGI
jgi:hypothetical protein